MTILKQSTKTLTAIAIAVFVICSALALPALAQTPTSTSKPTPNFHITADPTSLTIVAGTKHTVAITLASQTKFAGKVLTSAQTSNVGIVAKMPPAVLFQKGTTSVTTTLTIAVSAKTLPGHYKVLVAAMGGPLSHSVVIDVKVISKP